jgi:hypothetical protein
MPAKTPLPDTPAPAFHKTNGALLIAWAVIFLGVFFLLAGLSWQLALLRLTQDGGCAVAWLAACIGIGWLLWRCIDPLRGDTAPAALGIATCAALGMGILSLAILGLGLAGWLNHIGAIVIVAVGAIIAVGVIARRGRDFDVSAWLALPAGWNRLWLVLAPAAAIVVVAAFIPPGLLWGDEPNGYDVVEYHLQVPREWYEAGRIMPLHHNVFSYFPFNVEMHYLLAMQLHGGTSGPWAGMYLAQLMHATMCAVAVLAVYGLAGGGRRGIVAGLLVGAVPWVSLLAPIAYNEGGTLMWGILAIGWAIRARKLRAFLMAGLMAGFAGGSKLPILPLLWVGVPIVLILVRPVPIGRIIVGCAAYLLFAVVALSPWLLRNDVWAHNPVFPEAMSVFGKAHFSAVQAERWREAYLPARDYRSPLGRLEALGSQVIIDWRYGFALLPLGIATMTLTSRNRIAICLLGLLIFQTLFWLLFTHLQSRFMVIAIPILALLVVQSERREWLDLAAVIAIGIACFSDMSVSQKLWRYLQTDRRLEAANGVGIIGRENLEGFRLLDTRKLQPGESVDLIGDACAFWYQIPMARLHYKTVFDVDTSDPSKSIIEDWLVGMPRDALPWLDRSAADELGRFARTYYGIPALALPTTRQ